jgi:4-hydroxy-tetrahydrodipicolinate synthase
MPSAASSRNVLSGSLPVIPTPFFNGKVDYDSLLRLFDFVLPDLEGFTLGGSTGESVSMSLEERLDLIRFTLKNVPADRRVVVGLTHTNLEESKILSRTSMELGACAGLVPAPYYFPNSFEMVREYIRELGRASGLPLVFYDNPVYTKTALTADQLLALHDACPTLGAVKMTDHELSKISVLKEAGLDVFAGDDVVAFRSLLLGVKGSMIIAPAIFPKAYQKTVALLDAGDSAAALRVFSGGVLPFIHLFGMGDEIAVTKALYAHLGIFRSAELRLPLLPSTESRLQQALLAYELCMS